MGYDKCTLFDNGTKDLILFNYGRNTDGRNRFTMAPVTVLRSEGNLYICPVSSRLGGLHMDIKPFYNMDSCDSREPAYLQYDSGGWFGGEVVVLEENELGDWQSKNDSWKSVHKFCLNI